MDDLTRPATFDEFFNDYFGKVLFVPPFACPAEPELTITVDVQESDDAFTVLAQMPGVQAEVKAEKAVSAELRAGVLRVRLPKKAVS